MALPLTGIYSSTSWALEGLSEALRFRSPVGADAEALVGAHARLDDAAFDATLRTFLGSKR